MLVPVMVMNMLAVRWGVLPAPWLPYTSLPGFAFACAISSLTEFTGSPLRTITRLGTDPRFVNGTRNFTGLVGYPSCANALLEPSAATIDRMKTMKAKAAHHRTMGISVEPRVREYR